MVVLYIFIAILAALLLVLLLALFAPIKYNIECSLSEDTVLAARISWMFRLFRVFLDYNKQDNLSYAVKVGFYKLPDTLFASSVETKKDKADNTLETKTVQNIKSLLTISDIKSIILIGKILVKRLLKAMTPKIFIISGVVGLQDPALTGQIVGLCCAATSALGINKNIDIKGDFTQSIIDLDIKIAGKFAMFAVLRQYIWLLFQPEVKKFIKRRNTT